jgi:hypothetical protein
VPDLTGLAQLGQRPNGFVEWHSRIGLMQLVQVDALQLQPLEATVERRAQVLGSPVRIPVVRTAAQQPPFGRDHQAHTVRMQRFGDQLLADIRPICIRRVDQRRAQVDCTTQQSLGRFAIRRVTPYALPCDAHRAKTKPAHWQLAGDVELENLGDWR